MNSIAPLAPAAGLAVTLQADKPAASGATHTALTKRVNAGVTSLMRIEVIAPLPWFV